MQLPVLLTDFQSGYVQVTLAETRLSGDREVADSCEQHQLGYLRGRKQVEAVGVGLRPHLHQVQRHQVGEGELLEEGGGLLQAQQVALALVVGVQLLPHVPRVVVGVGLPEVHVLAALTGSYIFCSYCSFCWCISWCGRGSSSISLSSFLASFTTILLKFTF